MKAAIAEIAQSFARDGFAIVPNLFRREEVKGLKEGIQEILDEVRQESSGETSRRGYAGCNGRLRRSGSAQRPGPASRAR